MRFLILALLFVASACGDYGEIRSDSEQLGYALPVVSGFSSTDRENITLICNAISNKESRLDQLVGVNQSYNISQKNCSADEQVEEGVNVAIQDSGSGSYILKRVDNVPFIFPNVETLSSKGLLSSICNALPTIALNPEVTVGSNILQFTTVSINNAYCAPSGEELCIRVVSANATDRIIHTKEWLKVLARPNPSSANKTGLVNERTKITTGFCSLNEVTIQRATFQ